MTTETYAMTSTEARALLTAGQDAVRAVEQYGSPDTVRGLDVALCAFPLVDDRVHYAVSDAVRAVSLAEDSETWTHLLAMERAVSTWLHTPDDEGLGSTAITAVALLASHVTVESVTTAGRSAEERRAWERTHHVGVVAIRAIVAAVGGTADGESLDQAITAFIASVRRAVPYAALIQVRCALVEFARASGLFVIGMRQPTPNDRRGYDRTIGNRTFQFHVDPPTYAYPYGSVTVVRVAPDGSSSDSRAFPLYAFGPRRTGMDAVLDRI
ncbi:hypothetical protein [Streptomyces sp. NPDC004267]|uniref:hypothetical protein n=1 Tax=Streptomyces sp. NPDC004267 TaxID=3364694 RepID=UPI00368A7C9D